MTTPTVTLDPAMKRELQERAARALPAARTVERSGWLLRDAPGCAWWAATVLAHGEIGARELSHRVSEVERFYAENGGVAVFQITPQVSPSGLDALLADRGYRSIGPISLQVATTAEVISEKRGFSTSVESSVSHLILAPS